jgi:hypothetical protein
MRDIVFSFIDKFFGGYNMLFENQCVDKEAKLKDINRNYFHSTDLTYRRSRIWRL